MSESDYQQHGTEGHGEDEDDDDKSHDDDGSA